MVLLLLFFEPYARGICLEEVSRALRTLAISHRVVRNWGLRALVEVSDISNLDLIYDHTECVSRISIVYSIMKERNPELIVDTVHKAIDDVFRDVKVRIEVRRWDKSYPLTSVELTKRIVKALIERGVNTLDINEKYNVIIVGIERDCAIVAYTYRELVKDKHAIPLTVVSRIVAIIDRPQTQYEIMDLIQLSRALRLELRLFRPDREALNRAIRSLGIESKIPELVKVYTDLESLFRDVDLAIALTPYAKDNELQLIEILRENRDKRIAFVLGNEYEDVSQSLRAYCKYSVRLGPRSEMPMRTTTALAYVLGLTLPVLAGYVPLRDEHP